jgi:tRNA-dihydrouridine synthase
VLDCSTSFLSLRFLVTSAALTEGIYTHYTVCYIQMIPAATVTHNEGELDRFLSYNDSVEHPIILQLGGSDPDALRTACKLAAPYGYDGLNLNCGCPSERVAGECNSTHFLSMHNRKHLLLF